MDTKSHPFHQNGQKKRVGDDDCVVEEILFEGNADEEENQGQNDVKSQGSKEDIQANQDGSSSLNYTGKSSLELVVSGKSQKAFRFNIDQVRGGPKEVVGPVGNNETQVEEVIGPDTKKPKVGVYGNQQNPIVEEVSEKNPYSTTLNMHGPVDNLLKENSPRCVKRSDAKKLDVGNIKCDRRKTEV
ncbi:hypothetical protein L6452_13940 [Arctium lappa]|uniref:Uncharacterized protein n=1 Tax=Arctium lappa TaxID=4217 RepID=A0ACB9CJL8_ARCLA|nr:hypothetical protein L6452_13940 [Arctium lappa]